MNSNSTHKCESLGAYRFYNVSGNAYTEMIDEVLNNGNTKALLSLTKSEGTQNRHYRAVVDTKDIMDLVRKYNRNLCETMVTYPHRLYFDMDFDKTKPQFTDKTLTIDDVIAFMKQEFGLNDNEFTIAGYDTPKKTSYHVVATRHIITSYDHTMKLRELVKSLKERYPYLDESVYHKNAAMKCVYQSKPNGAIAQPLYPDDAHLMDHFISTSFVPVNHVPYNISKMPGHNLTTSTLQFEKMSTMKLQLPTTIGNEADMMDARSLLSITPCIPGTSSDNHNHRTRVYQFCLCNGLNDDDYMDWIINTEWYDHTKKPKVIQLMTEGKKFHKDTDIRDVMYYRNYLGKLCYPELLHQNHNTGYFQNSFELPIEQVMIDRIEECHYDNPTQKALVFNICMGGGKTTTTLQYLKRNPRSSFVWLAPRQTLVSNTSFRMRAEYNIKHVTHLNIGKDKHKLTKAEQLLICNQSLHHLDPKQFFDIVVIDEIETVLHSWLDDETHKKNLGTNFTRFVNILTNARKLILLDAFITTNTLTLLNDIGIPNENIIVYGSVKKPAERQLVNNKSSEAMIAKIVKAVINKEKCFIFYPYKKGTQKTHYSITDLVQRITDDVLAIRLGADYKDTYTVNALEKAMKEHAPTKLTYYAESDDKTTMSDVNAAWSEVDYVVSTSSITVGVNYDLHDFHHVFLFISGRTNRPRDIIQSSMRVRYPLNTDINVHFLDEGCQDVVRVPLYFSEGNNQVYRNLIIRNLREVQAECKPAFRTFCGLTNYKVYDDFDKKANGKSAFENEYFTCANLQEYLSIPQRTMPMRYEEIKKKLYERCITFEERMILLRYEFDMRMRNYEPSERQYIWNNNKEKFFYGIHHPIVKQVLADNNAKTLAELDLKTMIVGGTAITCIEKEIVFARKLTPKVKAIEAINQVLGVVAFDKKIDKSRNATYTHNIHLKELCSIYLMTKEKITTRQEEQIQADAEVQTDFIVDEAPTPDVSKLAAKEAMAVWKVGFYKHLKDEDFVEQEDAHGDFVSAYKYLFPWERNSKFFRKTYDHYLQSPKLRTGMRNYGKPKQD